VQDWERAVHAANARAAGHSQQLAAAHDRMAWLEAELQRTSQMQVCS
jgi:hypothetical protein